jgi:hypothetical protein
VSLDFLFAPLELCMWDDLCAYGNGVIEALNDCRHCSSTRLLNPFHAVLKTSLQGVSFGI